MSSTDVLSLPDDASRAFAVRVTALARSLRTTQGRTATGGTQAVEVLEGPSHGTFELTTPTDAPPGTAAVIRTSGSTGMPKRTALSAAALAASAASTREHLGGDGHWLLALPLHYVAGLAVVSRALLGTVNGAPARLATLDLTRSFTPEQFVRATDILRSAVGSGERLYTSLVPTQLTRLLDSEYGIQALREYSAILVGGGRTPEPTRMAAAQAQLPVVYTYGSAETCGGCVYNGVALPGVSVTAVDGRLRLGGDMVASGYLGDPDRTREHFVIDQDGTRFYITDDLGTVVDGVVSVSGRTDDVINTGGVKVSAQAVQQVVECVDGVGAVLIVGVPDPVWGQKVAMGWEPAPGVGHEEYQAVEQAALAAARAAHGGPGTPRTVRRYASLPRLGNGKPDRVTIAKDLAG
ncbi:MAG: AMP-binding protein [Galactobacter sp.]